MNEQYGIYDRSGTVLANGSISSLTNVSDLPLSDPQVIWDPQSSRFYYSIGIYDQVANNYQLAYGFSLGASPTRADSFCKYTMNFYGSTFPDEPKLGDFANFILVGVNAFAPSSGTPTALVNWISKPPSGTLTNCPQQSSFTTGALPTLTGFAPIPANEADSSQQRGYVLTTPLSVTMSQLTSSFSLYTLTSTSSAVQIASQSTINVASYSTPPNAPQPGGNYPLDTRDGNLTQAVFSFDPSYGVNAIWTQHTIATADGKRSLIRWYELNPAASTVLQSNSISDSSLFVFNGGIASDRAVNNGVSSYGQDMAVGFNTSSSSSYVAIRMVYKDGPTPQSTMQVIKQATVASVDICFSRQIPNACRWGDYPGASPDPLGVDGSASQPGAIWFSNTWVQPQDPFGTGWHTWNWEAQVSAQGKILASFTPTPSGNGRGMAADPSRSTLYYSIETTNIYVIRTNGEAVSTLAPGVVCGALAWDAGRQLLWCGAYDGTGDVYTVNPSTGVATLQFAFAFSPGENCFGQPAGYIDGLAYDQSDGTLWLSDDGASVLHHVDLHGNGLGSWSTPQGLCNSGIAVDTSASTSLLWLVLTPRPVSGGSHYAAVSKGNPQLVEGQVPYQGPGVPEGIAFDSTTFSPQCALWSNPAGSSNQIVATNVAPYCP